MVSEQDGKVSKPEVEWTLFLRKSTLKINSQVMIVY